MFRKKSDAEKLMEYLGKMDSEEIIGVMRLMKIPLVDKHTKIPRSAEDMFADLFTAIDEMDLIKRERFFAFLKKCTRKKKKKEVAADGSTTDNQ